MSRMFAHSIFEGSPGSATEVCLSPTLTEHLNTESLMYKLNVNDQQPLHCLTHYSLQAIGDGGQGWGNAILYVFLSPTIRQKLFTDPCEKCLGAAENRIALLLETETETNDSEARGSTRSSPATAKASGYKIKRYTSKRDSTDDSCSSNHKIAPATTNSAV